MDNKVIVTGVIIVVIIAAGAFFLTRKPADQPIETVSSPSTQNSTDTSTETTSTDTSSPAAEGAVKEFTVTGKNYSFSPKEISVNQGDKVKITLKSSGGSHNLVIDDFNVATGEIGNGEEDTIEFVADKAGTFEFYCSISNHKAMGMKGTLTVK